MFFSWGLNQPDLGSSNSPACEDGLRPATWRDHCLKVSLPPLWQMGHRLFSQLFSLLSICRRCYELSTFPTPRFGYLDRMCLPSRVSSGVIKQGLRGKWRISFDEFLVQRPIRKDFPVSNVWHRKRSASPVPVRMALRRKTMCLPGDASGQCWKDIGPTSLFLGMFSLECGCSIDRFGYRILWWLTTIERCVYFIIFDWLVDWLIDWVIDWLVDWLIGWFGVLQNLKYV